MYSYLIKNCRVIDGSGNDSYRGDVGLEGDTIAATGRVPERESAEVIDGTGLVLAPGFIDLHSHSDLEALLNPGQLNKISQGVTTEVAGNCGFSLFPVTEAGRPAVAGMMKAFNKEMEIPWSTGEEFYDLLEKQGIDFNYFPLVGHGMLRLNTMGLSASRANNQDLQGMCRLLEAEMEAGARGFSTGLGYMPGCFADTAELIALGKTAARLGGVYTSHIRNQGRELLDSIDEAVEVGRGSGIPVIVSHLKAYGVSHWGKAEAALDRIEAARRDGVTIMADFYPYDASSSTLLYEMPEWVKEGGPEQVLKRLSSPELRDRIRRDLDEAGEIAWERVTVCGLKTEGNSHHIGKTIADIAAERGDKPFDTAMDLLMEEQGGVETVCSLMSREDVDRIAAAPFTAVGSDGYALNTDKPFKGHPRNYGTFPRFFREYVRERKLLSLEAAVRKTSTLAAEFLGLSDRGRIEPGMKGDLVLFDPETITDKATFENPAELSEGIKTVFINGTPRYGIKEGCRSGKVLRAKEGGR